MLDRLLNWIKNRGGSRMIMRDGKPYLERFYLFKSKWLTIVIHKFWANDPDEPHDHPWHWASYVLRGCYFENHVDGTREYRTPGSLKIRRSTEFHRITMEDYWANETEDGPAGLTTTLFFMGRRHRDWGFLRGDKWINAKEYDRQAVEVQGRDFTVSNGFFPKITWHRSFVTLNVPAFSIDLPAEPNPLNDWADEALSGEYAEKLKKKAPRKKVIQPKKKVARKKAKRLKNMPPKPEGPKNHEVKEGVQPKRRKKS